jgi:hypothetical protein
VCLLEELHPNGKSILVVSYNVVSVCASDRLGGKRGLHCNIMVYVVGWLLGCRNYLVFSSLLIVNEVVVVQSAALQAMEHSTYCSYHQPMSSFSSFFLLSFLAGQLTDQTRWLKSHSMCGAMRLNILQTEGNYFKSATLACSL